MKAILETLWALFVIGLMVAIFAIKCETDRLREQQTREWLTPPRTAGGKTDAGTVSPDPRQAFLPSRPQYATLPPLPQRTGPAWREKRFGSVPLAPMPRPKVPTAPAPRAR